MTLPSMKISIAKSLSLAFVAILLSSSSWAGELKSQLLPGTTTTRTIRPLKELKRNRSNKKTDEYAQSPGNHSPKPSIMISGPLSAEGLKTMANLLRRSSSYMRVCKKAGANSANTARLHQEKIIIWNCHLKTTMSPFWKRKNAILATFLALFYTTILTDRPRYPRNQYRIFPYDLAS